MDARRRNTDVGKMRKYSAVTTKDFKKGIERNIKKRSMNMKQARDKE